MNNIQSFEGNFDSREKYAPLAKWLLALLTETPETSIDTSEKNITQFFENFHANFYQQIPDFVEALLKKDPQAPIDYAPLLYHLASCPTCHQAYMELYDALSVALNPEETRMVVHSVPNTIDALPPRIVAQLCQLLISQAESVKHQAKREHANNDDLARLLLQQSLELSKYLKQHSMRHQATQDLLRVATLDEVPTNANPIIGSYTPELVGGSGTRGRRNIVRKAGVPSHPSERVAIYLHSDDLKGDVFVTQNGSELELHLQNIDQQLHGRYLSIDIPLGSLLDPVRWRGGNPRDIPIPTPVDEHGALTIQLGETELQLSKAEDYNLLEVMLSSLRVRETT